MSETTTTRPSTTASIADLKALGYEITVDHIRRVTWFEEGVYCHAQYTGEMTKHMYYMLPDHIRGDRTWGEALEPTGGFTMVLVVAPDGRFNESVAECSDTDCYNKKLGVKIALGRALAALS